MGHPEKLQNTKSASTEAPPPSYGESNISSQPSSSAVIPRQFPPAFNLYRVSGWTTGKYSLGEHQNQPLYMCVWHGVLSRSHPLVLHSGLDESFPPLAVADWNSFFKDFHIELPPVNPSAGVDSVREEIQAVSVGFGSRSYRFSIEVGPNNVREQFEWRHSHVDAVRDLNGQSSGWKLVRLARGPPGGGDSNTAMFVPGGYMTSDGHEVVAAWAMNSGSKVGKFHFTGTGLSGLLGERWAIMAVMTFCVFIQRIRRQGGANGQSSLNA